MKMASGGNNTNLQCDGGPEELSENAESGQGRSSSHTNVKNMVIKGAQVGSLHAQEVHMENPIFVSLNTPAVYIPNSRRGSFGDACDEALRDPEPLPDMSDQFRKEDLELLVTNQHLAAASMCFNELRNCRWLARKINLDNTTMSSLSRKWSNDNKELAYQIMRAWSQLNPGKTVSDLVKALCGSRNRTAVEKLKEVLERERE